MGAEGNRDEGQEPAAPVKFSFSNGKPSNRRPPRPQKDKGKSHADSVEYVTAFDEERGIVSKSPRLGSGARIVPKLENSWRPEKRMKNIMMEADITASTEETFEMEETIAAGPKANVQYGLTVMSRVRVLETISEGIAHPAKKTSFQEMEDQKLREDLMVLPEEAALERYEELPVEEFGEALLRGMGWEKGKPIGRNAKSVIEPIEYVRRQGREGLGAVPAPPKETIRKYIKPGETREMQPDLVAPPRADGRSRNVVDPDVKLVERVRKGCAKGKFMSVISGRHAGLRGEVISIHESEGDVGGQVVLKLVKSGEKVVLSSHKLADVGSLEEEFAMKKMGELRIGNGKAGRRDERRSAEGDDSRERIRSSRSEDLREDRPGDNRSSRKNHPSEFADRRERSNSRDSNELEGTRGKRDGKRDDVLREADDREGRRGRRDSERDVDEGRGRKREGSSSGRRDKSSRKREVADEMDVDDEYERKRSRRREERREGDRSRHLAYERPPESEKGQDFDEKDHSGEQNGKDSKKIYSQVSREVVTATTLGSVKIQSEIVRTTSGLVDTKSRAYSEGERPSESWLRSHIRVRFISKSYLGGRLYLKKGRVIDVIRPKFCDVLLDESSEMLQDVRQEYLETALPKKGGRIMVVGGKHRGQTGKLLERDLENEVGVVQLEDSFEMVRFALEDLAELVGDPSEDDD